MKISFDIGDITKLDCDCIVNAANRSFLLFNTFRGFLRSQIQNDLVSI